MDNKFPFLPKFISTSFGAGFWPWGPGTMGAIVGLLLWLPLLLTHDVIGTLLINCVLIVVFTILGIWSAGVAERYWGPDPSKVVMDETVGQWIAMLPLCVFASEPEPYHITAFWVFALISLLLFRFFDIFKPLGVRKMEDFPGGTGIMADDILAGVYSAILLALSMYIPNVMP